MKEKFIFNDWRGTTWEGSGEIGTSMYGERKTEDGLLEEVFIKITLRASMDSVVVFRHYLGNCVHEQEVRFYTDTMKMMQEIKAYIDNLEK